MNKIIKKIKTKIINKKKKSKVKIKNKTTKKQ